MEMIFHAHSGLRYLILLAGFLGLLLFVRRRVFDRPDRVVAGIYVGLLDLNWVLGLILLIGWWDLPERDERVLHAVIMTAALITAHGFAIAARRRAPAVSSGVWLYVGSLLLIALGHISVWG